MCHGEQDGPSGDQHGGSDGKVHSAAAGAWPRPVLRRQAWYRGGNADDNATIPRARCTSQRLNPLGRLMQSPNAAAREAGARLFDDRHSLKKRFEDVGFDASAETLMKDWNGELSRALQKGTKAAFAEHWKAAGPLDAREFNEALGRALQRRRKPDDPQVARAAKLRRTEVFSPITDAAVKAGLLPDDVDPATANSYFSRTWSRNKLFAMELEFKETVARYVAERLAREQATGVRADVRASAREVADDLLRHAHRTHRGGPPSPPPHSPTRSLRRSLRTTSS